MNPVVELVDMLSRVLAEPDIRPERIQAFQRKVWDYPDVMESEAIDRVLRDLAYDLDYYEPDVGRRAEDESFFGEERLVEEVSTALLMLKNEGIDIEGPAIGPELSEE